MNTLIDDTLQQDDLVQLRRQIHAHPELAFQESQTAALVAERLAGWGLEVHAGIGKTGVVGVLRAGQGGRVIGLRADMDALPLTEKNLFAHRSLRPGCMHGCGHDGHTAMLLGAARELSRRPDFDGTVVFVFQPAEEGGNAGARAMIQDGLFERFPCDVFYGMHNWPGLAAGTFSLRSGPVMAGTALWDIRVEGVGGHTATPHKAVDSIVIGAELVQALQSVISRQRDPMQAAVLAITQIHAGDAYNVMPDGAHLCGTVRAFDPATMDQIERDMRRLAQGIPALRGGRGELDFRRGYPAVINEETSARFASEVIAEAFGDQRLVNDMTPTLAGEDFSFYQQVVPASFVFIGNGNTKTAEHDGTHPLHSPYYDFNDALLPDGVRFWSRLVRAYCSRTHPV